MKPCVGSEVNTTFVYAVNKPLPHTHIHIHTYTNTLTHTHTQPNWASLFPHLHHWEEVRGCRLCCGAADVCPAIYHTHPPCARTHTDCAHTYRLPVFLRRQHNWKSTATEEDGGAAALSGPLRLLKQPFKQHT